MPITAGLHGKRFANGLMIVFLPVNQGWAVLWGRDDAPATDRQILTLKNTADEAHAYVSDLLARRPNQ